MAYIPKNKIKTNLYSNGEYTYIDLSQPGQLGNIYSGEYYTLSTGKAFTGKYPGDGKNIPIIKRPLEGPSSILNQPLSLTTTLTPPLYPTPKDYEYGTFIRYFSKKRNEYLFEELTKDQYNILNTDKNSRYFVYKPFYIKWMLTGEKQTVTDFNYYSITSTEVKENVYGLNEFLKMDYLKYYR
jgi:hypothetical protein